MFVDQENIEKILLKDEKIIWCGKPNGDSFVLSCFPVFSMIWLVISGCLMVEYFASLAPPEATSLLRGIVLTLLATLPSWVGIGIFFLKVYEGKMRTLYSVTSHRVIKHYGITKSQYLFTELNSIQSVTYENDTFTHSTFKTGSLVLGLGHYEYNGSRHLTRIDHLDHARDILRLFKLISLKLNHEYKFINDPEPLDPAIEIEKVKRRKKAA